MTTHNKNREELAELGRLVEAWGGDEARWPSKARDRMHAIVAGWPDNRVIVTGILAEAVALDKVLDRAPVPAQSTLPALADRVFAAAMAGAAAAARDAPPVGQTGSNVYALKMAVSPGRPLQRNSLTRQSGWQAAGLMAASLLAGVYLGGSVNINPMLQELSEVLGLAIDLETASAGIQDETSDEDTL